ncbi:LysR family transcriptional regulator [Variovorax sp. EL159]|uniref:LysR family transcriptional regulator n=1 Tax=Variovorax sp. EL159 TaxID=1566270 RepID=UPI00088975E6|nr:LysR family transcriptional regulator [Variovorax sp. EL159]SCX72546.1 DNA-binding transcriptional regulator, LysR family [Variovorax sp. EL159]
MDTTDHSLRQFVFAARSPSLRKAAETLAISQPALSKQIRRLEEQLGFALFRRHGRGIALTASGVELLARLEPAFDQIDSALAAATSVGRSTNYLSISTVNTLAAYLLPDLVVALRQSGSSARLTLLAASSQEVVESVVRGKADMGFVYDVAIDSEEVERILLLDELLVGYRLAGSGSPCEIAVAELANLPLILPPHPYVLRRIVERECGRPLHPAIESNSVELTLDLVAADCGMGILPAQLGSTMVDSRGLERVRIIGGRFERKVAVIHRRQCGNQLVEQAIGIARNLVASVR